MIGDTKYSVSNVCRWRTYAEDCCRPASQTYAQPNNTVLFRIAMLEQKDFNKLLLECFPVRPIPDTVWLDAKPNLEILEWFDKRFLGKQWTSVHLDDWLHVGDTEVLASQVTPEILHYYLPSLLRETVYNENYIDWGVRALLPGNQERVPRGRYWQEYVNLFDKEQKGAVAVFLDAAERFDEANHPDSELCFLVNKARNVWV